MKKFKITFALTVAITTVVALTGCSASDDSKQIAAYAETLPHVTDSKTVVGLVGDFPKAVSSVKVLMDENSTAQQLKDTAAKLTSYAKTHGGVGDPDSLNGKGTSVKLYYHGVSFEDTTPAVLTQFIYKVTRNSQVTSGEASSGEFGLSGKPRVYRNLDIIVASEKEVIPMANYSKKFPEVENKTIQVGVQLKGIPSKARIQDVSTTDAVPTAKALAAIPGIVTYDIAPGSVYVLLKAGSNQKQQVEPLLNSLKTQYKAAWKIDVQVDVPATPSN